jgi:hypothetical protein
MKPVTEKNLHVVDTTAKGFCSQKPAEPTADMMRDALDSLFTGNFEMADSRALDLIGRGSQSKEAPKLTTFSDLAKAGVQFGSSGFQIRTASQEPMRIIEAMDRGVDTQGMHKTEAPALTYVEKRVALKKPKRTKAPATIGYGMHDFDAPRPKRQPLVDGLRHYAGHYLNVR